MGTSATSKNAFALEVMLMKKSSEVKFTEWKSAIQKDNECERKFYLVLPCTTLLYQTIKTS